MLHHDRVAEFFADALQQRQSDFLVRDLAREITHQEIGLALLQRIREELGDAIVVEQFPKLEGRQMIMMIAPGRKKSGGAKPVSETAPVAQPA